MIPDEKLLQRRWFHAHEEDSEGKVVYRPDDFPLPPSRGRLGYEFQPGGRVIKLLPGPTDKRTTASGTWRLNNEGLLSITIDGRLDEVVEIDTLNSDLLVLKKTN